MTTKNTFIEEVIKNHPHGTAADVTKRPVSKAIEDLILTMAPTSIKVTHMHSHAWQQVYRLSEGAAEHSLRVHYNGKNIVSNVTILSYSSSRTTPSAAVQGIVSGLKGKSIYNKGPSAPMEQKQTRFACHDEFLESAVESLRCNGFKVLTRTSCSAYHLKLRIEIDGGKEGDLDLHFNGRGEHTKTSSTNLPDCVLMRIREALYPAPTCAI